MSSDHVPRPRTFDGRTIPVAGRHTVDSVHTFVGLKESGPPETGSDAEITADVEAFLVTEDGGQVG